MIHFLTLHLYALRALVWLFLVGPTVALLIACIIDELREVGRMQRKTVAIAEESRRILGRRLRVVTGGAPTPTRKEARR